jgi:rhamnulose-1-phosphate aldolase
MQAIAEWLWELGEAGRVLHALGALEGAAGNISLWLPPNTPGLDEWLTSRFPRAEAGGLPGDATLPPGALLITGTGRRLRDVAARPEATLCALVTTPDGASALRRAPGHDVRPTSELDSHVGIHAALLDDPPRPQAVIHAQPRRLTYLSHIPAYRDAAYLNRRLYRWQPETTALLPEGIGVLPFITPGTPQQGAATTQTLRDHRLLVWSKHGVVARAAGPLAAADLIEYAEAAADYEVMDLMSGGVADGLSEDEQRVIAERFGVAVAALTPQPPLPTLGEGE